MRTQDYILMEQAYVNILEGKETPPCPCTVGKKCKKTKCPCTKCKKDKSKMMKEDNEEGSNDSLSDPQMQEAMAILNQYAQGDISNVEAANMFKDLYEKGAGHSPSQDDQYYTKLQ